MKMTLQEKANMLNVQYILEYLIEHYDKAECESERYRIKLLLFDFIKDTEVSLKQIVDYMSLDEDKFRPFLDILKNIEEPTTQEKQPEPPQSTMFNMVPPSICYVIRRQ